MSGAGAPQSRTTPIELREYLAAIRRRWIWPLAGLVLGLLLGTVTTILPTSWEATATVLLQPLTLDPLEQLTSSSIDTATERQIATSVEVATIAINVNELDVEPEVLLSDLVVTPAADANVLRFNYSADSASAAADGANMFAAAYITHRDNRAQDALNTVASNLQAQFDEVVASQRAAERRLANLLAPRTEATANEIRRAETAAALLATRRALIEGELESLERGSVRGGETISPATVPDSPSGLGTLRAMLVAGLIGMAIGMAAAIWRYGRSRPVTDGAMAADLLGVEPIVFVHDPTRSTPRPADPTDRAAMARMLRTLQARSGRMPQTIALLPIGDPESSESLATAIRQLLGADHSHAPLSAASRAQAQHPGPAAGHREVRVLEPLELDDTALDIALEEDTAVIPVVRINFTEQEDLVRSRRDLTVAMAEVPGMVVIGPRAAWGLRVPRGFKPSDTRATAPATV